MFHSVILSFVLDAESLFMQIFIVHEMLSFMLS